MLRNLKKLSFLLFALIFVLNAVSCTHKNQIKFPDKSDFELTYTISNKHPKPGDDITVNAKLRNKTNQKYTIYSGPSVIYISLTTKDDNRTVGELSLLKITTINPNDSITQQQKIRVPQKGQFKLIVQTSHFEVLINGHTKSYYYKGATTYIS